MTTMHTNPLSATENIVEGLRNGESLQALSTRHRLSREAIRLIGERAGLPPREDDDYLAPAQITLLRQVSTTVCHALDAGAVFTMLGLRERFGDVSPKFVMAAIKQAEITPLLGYPDPPEKIEYTPEDMYAALRAAADQNPGAPLTGSIYDRALKDGTVTGPSRVLIIQRIGSWATACEAAGVPFRGARRTYDGFQPSQVREWLDRYALDMVATNTEMTFAGYSAWARLSKQKALGAPSGSLIKARMLTDTTWNQMRDELILRTYRAMPEYWVRVDD